MIYFEIAFDKYVIVQHYEFGGHMMQLVRRFYETKK